ncbi:unnamed protein product [Larinioides sclopetarius]|uniref:Uncharacterized protein n=1 Tax=Larinioides sclopetarius TaxID=280406 RepID=A0AAV2B1R9_9ARAC
MRPDFIIRREEFEDYIRKLPRLQIERFRLSWYFATGVITYFTSIHCFSEALKCNNKVWIPCLGVVVSGYHLAASSVTRVESNNEPRWLLFKGIELFVGGCLLLLNGSFLVAYSVNNQFHPLFIGFCTTIVSNGVTDITSSLESFQGCVEMEAPVFYCICGMIGGPIVFLSACLGIRCICHPVMLPVFVVTAGTGLALLGKSIMDLHDLVPQPVFKRYCQRVLGPVVTVYSSLAAAYVGYSMGWRFSLVMLPFIPAGIYTTYQGFRRRNRP